MSDVAPVLSTVHWASKGSGESEGSLYLFITCWFFQTLLLVYLKSSVLQSLGQPAVVLLDYPNLYNQSNNYQLSCLINDFLKIYQ